MRREQIEALEGRELDAAVAEHVMGWTPQLGVKNGEGCYPWKSSSGGEWFAKFSGSAIEHNKLWDKLVADGHFVRVEGPSSGNYRAEIAKEYSVFSFGPDRYIALCRAALLAYSEAAI